MGNQIKTRKQLREIANSCGVVRGKGGKIQIFEDGTILRADVRQDLATPMTVKAAVKYLEL